MEHMKDGVGPFPNRFETGSDSYTAPDEAVESHVKEQAASEEPENHVKEKKDADSQLPFDLIARIISDGVKSYAARNAEEVGKDVRNVIRTIVELNRQNEYARRIVVDGDPYLIGEYNVPVDLACLVAPRKVVYDSADEQAIDLLKHEAFKMTIGKVLTPGEVDEATQRIYRGLRMPASSTQVVREVMSLTTAAKLSSRGLKVRDLNQDGILPLTIRVIEDGDYCIRLDRWAERYAGRKFKKEAHS